MLIFLKKSLHWVVWVIGKKVLFFLFKIKVENEDVLKNLKGPLLIVFNHCSWLDPLFLIAAIPPKFGSIPVHFAVWHGHYYKPMLRPFLSFIGAFPVKRKIGLEKTLAPALKILKENGIVGMAPEGKRRHFGRPRKARRGAAFLALKTNSPLLPIYMQGALGLKIKDVFKRKIVITIGPYFSLKPQEIKKDSDLNIPTDLIRKKLFELEDKTMNLC